MGDLQQLSLIRDDLRAAVSPLPIPLRQLAGDPPIVVDVAYFDYATFPSNEVGPFFQVSTALEAVLAIKPHVDPSQRTFTYEIASGFDADGQTFSVTVGGVASPVVGTAGWTPQQVLTELGTLAVNGTAATSFRVYATSAGTGKVDIVAPTGTAFNAFSASGANQVTGAVDPTELSVALYAQLNDGVEDLAPTRSGWALYRTTPDGCAVQVVAGADGVVRTLDARPYKWMYPYFYAPPVGVDGDDATALANGAFRSVTIRPCLATGKVVTS